MSENNYIKVKGEGLERLKKACPECGPGYFMGEHKDRYYCGKCHHTEFKK